MTKQPPSEIESPDFTRRQEWANSMIHVLGILFGLAAFPVLITQAVKNRDSINVFSIGIYGLCFLMVFTFSTLYHAFTKAKIKSLFKKFDRISIYFLIAGTYTPIIRYYLNDQTGFILLATLWGMVMAGFLFEVFFPGRFSLLSVMFYLLMGLIFVFVPRQFFSAMPFPVIILILSGVVLYSVGVIFYVWQKWHYHHALWHSFVLAAGICHYVAVLKTVS